jgi:predicted acylesterase/phospholipase RssA
VAEARSDGILRLAVAMRGGVSLAVWIGGAFFEIDRVRRAEPGDELVKGLFALTSFKSLEMDILTGASAGGLNAAIGGLAISRGQPSDLRETWIEAADIDRLLDWEPVPADAVGPKPNPKQRRSILNGDYFLRKVVERAQKLADTTPTKTARPVEMYLAATVFGGIEIHDAAEPALGERRHEAFFHFRHLARAQAFSDLFAPEIADRLGRAARSTASFPGAFEPVRAPMASFAGQLHLPRTDTAVDEVQLYDGGVVDNIPVARAIRASAAAPAVDVVRRWVVFLHPSPSLRVGAPQQDTTSVPSIPEVITDVVGSRGAETLLDDLDVLHSHNQDAATQAIQRYSLCDRAFGQQPPAKQNPSTPSVDASWLYGLLENPEATLPWLPIGKTVPLSPLVGCSPSKRYGERVALLTRLLERDDTIRPFARIARSAHVVVDWIRWVEDRTTESWADERRVVYDVMVVATLLESGLDHAFLAAAPSARLDVLEARLAETEASGDLHKLIAALGIVTTKVEYEVPLVERVPHAVRETLDQLAEGHVPPSAAPAVDGMATSQHLLRKLGIVGASLRAKSGTAADEGTPSLFTLVRRELPLESTPEEVEACLLTVDAACAGLHRGRTTGITRTLEYLRMSGAAPTPLADPEFAPSRLPKFDSLEVRGGHVDPKKKLAGDRVGNFSAFLSPRFRANDWMWGRMDAATGLVDILLRPAHLAGSSDDLICNVKKVVTAPITGAASSALAQSGDRICRDLWSAYCDAVCEEIVDAVAAREAKQEFSPDALSSVRALVLTRWHLELFLNDVADVLGQPLEPGAKPDVLPPMHQPTTLAEAQDNVRLAMRAYDKTDRHVGDIWGRRKTTALGVRVADRAARAATAKVPVVGRSAQLVLAAVLMFAVDAVLLRGAFLVSWALLVNVVLVPRVDDALRAVIVVLSLVLSLGYWRVCVKRKEHDKWRGTLTLALAALPTGFGIAALWVHDSPFRSPAPMAASSPLDLLRDADSSLWWSVGAVGVASAIATALLWVWAKPAWMLCLAAFAGLTMAWWVVVGAWTAPTSPDPDADLGFWLTRVAYGGSMWIPAIGLAVLATIIALNCSPEDR